MKVCNITLPYGTVPFTDIVQIILPFNGGKSEITTIFNGWGFLDEAEISVYESSKDETCDKWWMQRAICDHLVATHPEYADLREANKPIWIRAKDLFGPNHVYLEEVTVAHMIRDMVNNI